MQDAEGRLANQRATIEALQAIVDAQARRAEEDARQRALLSELLDRERDRVTRAREALARHAARRAGCSTSTLP